jgi:hypothetical protein
MDLLIKHGTWIIVPAGLMLAFVCTHVYAKVYPFLIARSLNEEDRRERERRVPASRQVVAQPKPNRVTAS